MKIIVVILPAILLYISCMDISFFEGISNGINPLVRPYAIGWIGGGSNGWQTGLAPTYGPDYNSFYGPSGVFVDKPGNIYIADSGNNRICKWDSNGNALGWIGGGSNGWQTGTAPIANYDYQSFNQSTFIFVDNSGCLYISDNDFRVSKWDSNGNAIGWIGGRTNGWHTNTSINGYGSDYQSFEYPGGIWVDNSGMIYVVDGHNNRVSKWDSNGNAIGWIGGRTNGWQTNDGAGSGNDYQSFYWPSGICLDGSGNIYVSDGQNNRVCKWDSNGNAIGWIGGGGHGWQKSNGTGFTENINSFTHQTGIFVDSSGFIYVADTGNHRIDKWNSGGSAIGWFGQGTNGLQTTSTAVWSNDYQSFNGPSSVFVDGSGNIYVADHVNSRICKWHQ